MSLAGPLPELQIPCREIQISAVVADAVAAVGTQMMFAAGGFEQFAKAQQDQETAVNANIRAATGRALQKTRVLDENLQPLSGQELIARRYGFNRV